MNKVITTILVLFLWPHQGIANKIDSIKTDADALYFLQSMGKNVTFGFRGLGGYTWAQLKQKHLVDIKHVFDSLKISERTWFKADLNNDGKTDMVAFTNNGMLAAVSSADSFCIVTTCWYEQFKYIFIFPAVKKIDGQEVILIYYLSPLFDTGRTLPLKCDTIIVKDNYFFNYLPKPRHYTIEAIELHDNGFCEGNCLWIDMKINARTLEGSYSAGHSLTKGENFSGQLSKEKVEQILNFLNYSNFSDLKEDYASPASDLTTTTWKIVYDGGKVKTIKDYGECGTVTLNAMFKLLALPLLEKYR